jgi:putative endonuclease
VNKKPQASGRKAKKVLERLSESIKRMSLRAEPREAWQSTIEMSQFYVYIMTCRNNTVLYTGVTRDLKKRVYEHISKVSEGFTKRYNLTKLVYYEVLSDPNDAIAREKQIKAGTRAKKIALVSGFNPGWTDLYERI